jgi:DNA-binding transcriptional LysR family regulator
MDRLTGLTVFVQVVDSGGFAAAARHLGMSTTMVSSHVQALEARLGVRLLNRTTRKVSVTDTGAAYYARCTQILAELAEADQLAAALHADLRGTLRAYLDTAMVLFIAPVITELLSRHPEVSVNLTVGSRAVDLVEEGFDLAIAPTPPPESSLIVRKLAAWRPVLCGSPGYLAAHGAPRHPDDLAGHNCLRYTYYPFGDTWRFTGPDGAPVSVRVAGNLIANNGQLLRFAVLDGQGLMLAPSFLVADDLAAGTLIPVLEDHVPLELAINAIYPHRHHLSTKVRRFLDLVAARLAAYRQWLDPAAAA